MPEYTRGQLRDQLRFVPINPIFLYGWKTIDLAARTGITQQDLTTQLGHLTPVAAAAVANRIMVTGANSPKPARVVRRDPTAPVSQPSSTSTYVAYNSLAAATAAGWTLAGQGRGVKLTADVDGRRSVTAIAELSNGALYCFPMNRADFNLYGATLGLEDPATITTDAERRSLVTGSRTKPGRASIETGTGVFSSFYATDAQTAVLAAGFSIDTTERIEYQAAAAGGGA
jgi:hypothetical protein